MNYQRFEALLKSHGTSVYRLAKATGISNSTFTDWKNGRSTPKADKLKLIADYFSVPVDYLIGSDAERSAEQKSYKAAVARKMVPIIGIIRAGKPIITNETLLGYELADIDDADDYFYLKVSGDSMKDCGMIDGSLVLFRKVRRGRGYRRLSCRGRMCHGQEIPTGAPTDPARSRKPRLFVDRADTRGFRVGGRTNSRRCRRGKDQALMIPNKIKR